MRTPPRQNAKDGSSSEVVDYRPEDLIRLLLSCAANSTGCSSQHQEGSFSEEVVLDIDVNGARYLLIRLPESSKAGVQLSPREHEIVRMVAMGHPNKIIADVLCISAWTVCTHLRRIFAKLGVGSRAAMVARLHDVRLLDVGGAPAQSALARQTTNREQRTVTHNKA